MFGGSELEESVDIGIVSTVDVVCSELVGTEDDMQHFLDMVLCDHENPRDQNFVGGSDGKRHQQPSATATTASRNRKRQHKPPAFAAAIAEAQASASAMASAITADSTTLASPITANSTTTTTTHAVRRADRKTA